MDLGLAGSVFLVSGGSQGLGLATAQALVEDGAQVVLVARDASRLQEAVDGMAPGAAIACIGDLGDAELPDRAVTLALETFGRLDGALVSVGGPAVGGIDQVTDRQWQAAFESVFLGSLHMTRSVAAHARRSGTPAAIALVLSTSAKSPVEGLDTSNGLRPGLAMLVKSMADQWGPDGVRVNALLPGRIATSRLQSLEESTPDPAATRARYETAIPLGRYGTTAEFGRVAAFVLSPAASYLTGSMVTVDGGMSRAL
jgi:3-oxoacyl-[acyl-carrier protein] reductase